MGRDGSGNYTRTDGVRTGSTIYADQDAVGVNIEPTLMDVAAQDIAAVPDGAESTRGGAAG